MFNKFHMLQHYLLYLIDSGEKLSKEQALNIVDNKQLFDWLSSYDFNSKSTHPKLDLSYFDQDFIKYVNNKLSNEYGDLPNYHGIENNGIILITRWLNEVIWKYVDSNTNLLTL